MKRGLFMKKSKKAEMKRKFIAAIAIVLAVLLVLSMAYHIIM